MPVDGRVDNQASPSESLGCQCRRGLDNDVNVVELQNWSLRDQRRTEVARREEEGCDCESSAGSVHRPSWRAS